MRRRTLSSNKGMDIKLEKKLTNYDYNQPSDELDYKERDWIPARYVLTLLTFFGLGLQYTQRVCLNLTIVAMVNSTAIEANENDTTDDECPIHFSNTTTVHYEGKFLWSPSIQGVILGAFYYGYICTPLLGGRLSEIVGAKWLLGTGILCTSILTLVTPLVAHWGIVAMVIVRVLIGLGQGVNSASMYAMFSRWAPPEERSRMLSICTIGQHVGTIVTMSLTGFLCEYGFAGGWPSAFYVYGICGCLWFMFWATLVHNSPEDHPRISKKELMYIQQNLPQFSQKKSRPIPWKNIFKSKAVWAVTIAKFSGTWGFTSLLTKLPAYLADVLHFPMQKNGFTNSLVYVAEILCMLVSGYTADALRKRNNLSTTCIRKMFESVALLGPAFCLIAVPIMGCDSSSVVVLLVLSMGLYGMVGGGDIPVFVDIAPEFAGTIFGLANGLAGATGFLTPLVAGIFLDSDHGGIQQWSKVFYSSAAIYVIGAAIFVIIGSAEPESWAVSEPPAQIKVPSATDKKNLEKVDVEIAVK
ncbi:sialin-like [Centruroides sculpturatus]|uniref:sialin-like n=1 Tax=Centruroides sculpturatus TaxID=218467 RepID=UPI000C6CBD77|nr:sialin-like [Centruroides sculpturatus]